MNSFFRRLSLPVKLALVGLIPLIFLLYILFQLFQEKTAKVDFLEAYINRIHQSATINSLIDELQNERKYSFDYAMKKSGNDKMLQQRLITDSILNLLESSHDSALSAFTTYTFLNNLPAIRSQIDTALPRTDVVMSYYTNAIFRLNFLSGLSAENNYLKPVAKDLASQKPLSQMVTYLSIMRSNIYNVLYSKQNGIGTLYGLAGIYEFYQSYQTEFLIKAPVYAKEEYRKIAGHGNLKRTNNYLDLLFSRMSFDSTYNADQWWQVSGNAIDSLRNLQQGVRQKVEAGLNDIYHLEKNRKQETFLFLILSLIIVIGIVGYTIHVISNMLSELELAAQKIAIGATNLQIKIFSKDAIGSLANSILKINENNKLLAKAADAIGQGDFAASVFPRGSDDVLGNAIVQMKNNLQKFTVENEEIKEHFRQLADFMPQMVWTTTPDGIVDYYNKRWYEFTGFPENSVGETWIAILHPDDKEYSLAAWHHAVKTGEDYQIEYRFKDKSTRGYKWFLAKALPIKDENKNVIKWFGTCTEIQDQKMIAEELERKVKERTQDLKEANAELERSNKDLEQYAFVASHDLQEPVRKIKIFTDLIKSRSYESLDDDAKNYLLKVASSTDRLHQIIKDLLNYASLNKNKNLFKLTDLNTIFEDIKMDLELLIKQKQAIVESESLPVIEAIPIQMSQLFYNLINNALKFSDKERKPVIKISAKRFDAKRFSEFPNLNPAFQQIEINFSDNGIGFDQQYAKQIFIMFQRLYGRKEYDGTGVGLALCKKIIDNHHGEIMAQSAPGKGSVFTIILPVLTPNV